MLVAGSTAGLLKLQCFFFHGSPKGLGLQCEAVQRTRGQGLGGTGVKTSVEHHGVGWRHLRAWSWRRTCCVDPTHKKGPYFLFPKLTHAARILLPALQPAGIVLLPRLLVQLQQAGGGPSGGQGLRGGSRGLSAERSQPCSSPCSLTECWHGHCHG